MHVDENLLEKAIQRYYNAILVVRATNAKCNLHIIGLFARVTNLFALRANTCEDEDKLARCAFPVLMILMRLVDERKKRSNLYKVIVVVCARKASAR